MHADVGPVGDRPVPPLAPVPQPPFGDQFHRVIVDNLADGVYYVTPDRRITYWNRGAERITGYSAPAVVGRLCYSNLLSHVDDAGVSLCHTRCPLAATMEDGVSREQQVWFRHRDGHRHPVRVRTAPIRDESGAITGGVEIFDDATTLVAARQQVESARRDALTDELTGLPNRRHYAASVDGRLENLRRYGWAFGLLIIDLDGFKELNDSIGHDSGDLALVSVGRTLAGAIRAGDLVARWGGDEFAVLVSASDHDALQAAAERLRLLLRQSVLRLGGREFAVRVSVGGTAARLDDDGDTLFARADAALYRAKAEGRDRSVIA